MEAGFWHERWAKNEIGFHEPDFNVLLTSHFDKLALPEGSRIFVPLCGKTRDIAWLLKNDYQVVGAELSEVAVQQLFGELGVEPAITQCGWLQRYVGPGLTIFAGDIFQLTPELLGHVDGIYDRAALVALPQEMRARYAQQVLTLSNRAPQLLICFEYDQHQMPGPPFSVSGAEVEMLYGAMYHIRMAEARNVAGGLKGKAVAEEIVWLLRTD